MIAAITITLGWWLAPTLLTLVLLWVTWQMWLSGGFESPGDRWVIWVMGFCPINFVWAVYFGLRLLLS